LQGWKEMNAAISIADALRRGETVRPTHMAVALGVSKQNVCQILNRWELKGAVEKRGVGYHLLNANLLPLEERKEKRVSAPKSKGKVPDICAAWGIRMADIKLPSKRYNRVIGEHDGRQAVE
jgi:hypothetical protein